MATISLSVPPDDYTTITDLSASEGRTRANMAKLLMLGVVKGRFCHSVKRHVAPRKGRVKTDEKTSIDILITGTEEEIAAIRALKDKYGITRSQLLRHAMREYITQTTQ